MLPLNSIPPQLMTFYREDCKIDKIGIYFEVCWDMLSLHNGLSQISICQKTNWWVAPSVSLQDVVYHSNFPCCGIISFFAGRWPHLQTTQTCSTQHFLLLRMFTQGESTLIKMVLTARTTLQGANILFHPLTSKCF